MADSFIRLTLRDGASHTVVLPANTTAEGLIELLAKGQAWPAGGEWVEVEGGGAVTRRLVATEQIVVVELFERP